MEHPLIADGIERLRTRWPQAHAIAGAGGNKLIVVPSVLLCDGWLTSDNHKLVKATICTVLFVAPPGYPAARPDHFFTDIELRLANKPHTFGWPYNTNMENGSMLALYGWPQWAKSMWWSWHLQMWNPNHSSLFTYMKVIQQRLAPAR